MCLNWKYSFIRFEPILYAKDISLVGQIFDLIDLQKDSVFIRGTVTNWENKKMTIFHTLIDTLEKQKNLLQHSNLQRLDCVQSHKNYRKFEGYRELDKYADRDIYHIPDLDNKYWLFLIFRAHLIETSEVF